ncbi:hypothetical protein [Paractinoplanes globisporus]|uniref:GSKIP domain-containing protein n=1 Tax=Paractinoplanes globisporus TaxID=113565 RepID=A0ABW6WSU4_9ACTN|nr:hypothetical protein [Actinoplanes globisporus]
MANDDAALRRSGEADSHDIKGTITRIFAEMTEIKVVTAVGKVEIVFEESGGRTKTKINTPDPPTDVLITIFDLVDGDVTNVISPGLQDNQALRDFHLQQVERSVRVLPEHFKALIDAAETILNRKW